MADIIPAEFQQFVQLAVANGEYASEVDVVAAGLRLLQQRKVRLAELRAELQIGRDQLDRGEFTEHDEESLQRLFDELGQTAIDGRQQMDDVYAVVSERYRSAERDVAERHNEHQP